MERRLTQRTHVRIEAYIISEDKTYVGFIENVSEDGLEFLALSAMKAPEDFYYGKKIEIFFQIPSGELLNMSCCVKWLSKDPSADTPLIAGMKITDPSPGFESLLKTMDIVNVN
jgi:hypothetical protein